MSGRGSASRTPTGPTTGSPDQLFPVRSHKTRTRTGIGTRSGVVAASGGHDSFSARSRRGVSNADITGSGAVIA